MSATYGATCGAINCSNSHKNSPHLSYFRFPKDPERMTKLRQYVFVTAVMCLLVLWCYSYVVPHVQDSTRMRSLYKNISFDGIFKGFNNESGTANGSLIVPNIVHFLRFNLKTFSYVDTVCVLAAYRNQRPEKIMFHTNMDKFEGDRWDKIRNTRGINIEIVHVEIPKDIFGQQFNKGWHVWHSSDVTRIRILMKYGGIFLDNDVYVVKSLDRFRRYEMALGWQENDCLGTQVLVAHKEARFLRFWLESYREYNPNDWYYNAGCKPTYEVLNVHPELIHKVKLLFGVQNLLPKLYTRYWGGWRNQYTIHLIIRYRWSLGKRHIAKWPEFNETNIVNFNMTFGEMAREAYSVCWQWHLL